jgi:hypothetical protein
MTMIRRGVPHCSAVRFHDWEMTEDQVYTCRECGTVARHLGTEGWPGHYEVTLRYEEAVLQTVEVKVS